MKKEKRLNEAVFSVTKSDIEKINSYSLKPLSEEEVFVFSVILCDNEIDRDFERFSVESLKALKELFKGVTGIFDHSMRPKTRPQGYSTLSLLRTKSGQPPQGALYLSQGTLLYAEKRKKQEPDS